MLEGITIKPLKRMNDERGAFTELLRQDWKDLLPKEFPVQANFSVTYPGTIRAWHRHVRGQTDYMIVTKGSLKICIYDENRRARRSHLKRPRPAGCASSGHYWHGFKALGNETAFLVYFTTRLYDYHDPDEEKTLGRPHNKTQVHQ